MRLALPRRRLDDGFDIFTAPGKIFAGILLFCLEQSTDVCFQFDVQVIVIDYNAICDEADIPFVQIGLFQNTLKDLHDGLGLSIGLNEGVAQVDAVVDLMGQTRNSLGQLGFQIGVGLADDLGLLRRLSDGVHQLAFQQGFELGLGSFQLLMEGINGVSDLLFPLRLGLNGSSQLLHDPGSVVRNPFDIPLQKFIQFVHADLMGGTGFQPPALVGATHILGGQPGVGPGEHGASTVSAKKKPAVIGGVFLLAPIVASGALLQQLLGVGEGARLNDGCVCIFDDDLVGVIHPLVGPVDVSPLKFVLTKGSDVKVIAEDFLHRDDAPGVFADQLGGLSCRFLLGDLVGPGGGNTLFRQVIGDLAVAPSVVVQAKNLPNHFCRRWVDFVGHFLRVDEAVAIGNGANPPAIPLTVGDDLLDFFAGIRDRELVHQELELDEHPVVLGGIVDGVPHGDDADMGVPQGFQFQKPQAVPAGEPGEVLDHQDGILSGQELWPHPAVVLSLGEGIARAVPIFKKIQLGVRKLLEDKITDYVFLVLDGGVVLIFLDIHGDSSVTGNFQCCFPPLDVL